MDPDIQRELEEQFREMIAMLSQTNATMAGTVKAMNDAAASSNKSAAAQDANTQTISNNTGGQTRLAEAAAKAAKQQDEMRIVLERAGQDIKIAVGGVVGSLSDFTKAMMNGKGGFAEYNSAIQKLGDTAIGLTKDIPVLGAAFGVATKATVALSTATLTLVDQIKDFRNGLAKSAGVTNLTASELSGLAKKAGFTGENMAKLQTITSGISSKLLILDKTAGDGAAKFLEVADVGEKTRKQFSRLGIGFTEITELQAKYVEQQANSGRAAEMQAKSAERVRQESVKYALELVKLTTLTGKNADQMQQDRDRVMLVREEQLAILGENNKISRLRRSENADDRAQADKLEAAQKRRLDFAAKISDIIGPDEAAQVSRMMRTGVADEKTVGLAVKGFNPQLLEQLSKEQDAGYKFADKYAKIAGQNAEMLGFSLQFADEATQSMYVGSGQTVEQLNKYGDVFGPNSLESRKSAIDKTVAEKANDSKKDAFAEEQARLQEAQIKVGQSIQSLLEKQIPTLTTALNNLAEKIPGLVNTADSALTSIGGIGGMFTGLLAGGAGLAAFKGAKVLKATRGLLSGGAAAGEMAGAAGIARGAAKKAAKESAIASARAARSMTSVGGGMASGAASASKLAKLGGLAKGAGRVLGKFALPLTALLAAKDAYDGFTADKNASFGGKMANAGKSVLSGLTFGLSDYVTGGVKVGKPEDGKKPVMTTPKKEAKTNDMIVDSQRVFANSVKSFSVSVDTFGKMIQYTNTANKMSKRSVISSVAKASEQTMSELKDDERRETRDRILSERELVDTLITETKTVGNTFTSLNERVNISTKMFKVLTVAMSDFEFALSGKRTTEGSDPGNGGGGSSTTGEVDPEMIKKSMDYFQKQGWSKEQAAGIVGNLITESRLNASQVGDNGAAYGLAQWNEKVSPDRVAKFKEIIGTDLRKSSFDQQLQFIDWELKHGQGLEKKAGKSLKGATTAAQAAEIVDAQYERSSGAARGERIANAEAIASGNFQNKSKKGGGATEAAREFRERDNDLVSIGTQGKTAQVAKEASSQFQSLLDKLTSMGYKINSLGGYNDRDVRGKPGVPSAHKWGWAIDINPEANPMGDSLKTDLPKEAIDYARKIGLGWGGDWTKSKDAMHFSAQENEGGWLKAAKGGFFNGPKSGYPVELHGGEMVAPLDMNSVLAKLAKTPATQAETANTTMNTNITQEMTAGVERLASINSDAMYMLADKMSNMINILTDVNDHTYKLLQMSKV